MNNKLLAFVVLFVILLAISLVLIFSGSINFNPASAPKCVISGCSSELCVDQNDKSAPNASICIWSDKFSCYKTAKCEVQSSGKCGWTATTELNACLSKPSDTISPY